MNVCVIGTGYVGLVTGVCLAQLGHDVICVDNNAEKIAQMQAGRSPIYEPGLEQLMQNSMALGQLRFTTDLAAGVAHGTILFIAVGTPSLPTGESDTRYVEAVARGIGSNLVKGSTPDNYKVIVNKSTVPIGSGNWVRQIILDEIHQATVTTDLATDQKQWSECFDVVSNPEFLREGSAVFDTFNPDRIVLGSENNQAIVLMSELYEPLIHRIHHYSQPSQNSVPLIVTDLASAEMIKYAANAFLATKISFINDVANICDRVGADVTQVAMGIGLDSRIGPKFLQSGIGWGGSCFPKDVAALIHTAQDYGYEAPVLNAAVQTNRYQRTLALEKLQQTLKILKGKIIGLLGLTFKPNTDDMRDAPALDLICELHRLGAKVKVYDPIIAPHHAPDSLENVAVMTSVEDLADGCDALVLVTQWAEFQSLDYANLATIMRIPVMIDGRNALEPETMTKAGFYYVGIGRTAGNSQPSWALLKSSLSFKDGATVQPLSQVA